MLDKPQRAALLDEIAAIVGARYVLTEASDQAAYLTEMRNMFHGRALAVVRPGTTAEVGEASGARLAQPHAGGAARRQYGARRRAGAGRLGRRHHLVAHAARQGARGRSSVEHHDGRGRAHASQGPGSRRRRGSALSALARLGRLLHDRRQSFDECGRRRGARLWQCARPRARPRGRRSPMGAS